MKLTRFLLTLFLAFTVSMVFGQWDNVDDRSSGFSITQTDEFTQEYSKYPTRPLLVCWQGISGYGSRKEVNVTIVETTYGYYGIPADQLFKDLMLQLAVEGKLKKYKHLDNPKRERIELLSFMYVRDGFIYSSEQVGLPEGIDTGYIPLRLENRTTGPAIQSHSSFGQGFYFGSTYTPQRE